MQFDAPTITLLIAVVGFIIWLVRLESRANAALDKADKLSIDVYAHTENVHIHHSADDLDRRFKELKDDITEIKQDIKDGLKEIGNRIDRLLNRQ
jgi:uncharacterized protein YoxC